MTFNANAVEFRNDADSADDALQAFNFVNGPAEGPPIDNEPEPTKDESDADLIEAIWPHVPVLRKYLRRRVPVADLDDVVQDVLLSIVRRADAAAVVHPKCYLFHAAQAALIDRHRRQTTRHFSCHCEMYEQDHPVDDMSPLRILLARDDVQTVEDILRRLPERTREIIVAMRVEGLSLKILASRYDISTSAIEKHVTKAVKALSDVRLSCGPSARYRDMSTQRQKYLSGSI